MKVKNILTNTNSKIKKTAKLNNIRLYEFNLPAIDSCPFAKDCLAYCYANKGTYLYKNVQDKYKANYKLTKDSKAFINQVQSEIDSKKVEAIRIHSSGDFYNLKYVGLHSQHMLLPYKEMSKDQLHAVVGLLHLVKTETLLKGEK